MFIQPHFVALILIFQFCVACLVVIHTAYPVTNNATDNNKHSWNQQAGIGCKYLSGNNLPRILLIRGRLFPDRYLLPMIAYWFQ